MVTFDDCSVNDTGDILALLNSSDRVGKTVKLQLIRAWERLVSLQQQQYISAILILTDEFDSMDFEAAMRSVLVWEIRGSPNNYCFTN